MLKKALRTLLPILALLCFVGMAFALLLDETLLSIELFAAMIVFLVGTVLIEKKPLEERKHVVERKPKRRREKVSVRYCPVCGSEIPFDAKFCPYCGNAVEKR